AVATASWLYNDLKQITNCSFSSDDTTINDIAGFNLFGLGDALVFEHNAVHSCPYYALMLSSCYGGSVTANILNGDVMIDHCKGITLTSNHLEGNPQIQIIGSNVILNDNYMHKRSRPNLLLDGVSWNEMPVVELNNHSFIFLDYGGESAIKGVDEYDISIKGDVILNINNSYRYWIGEGLGGKMYPCGIQINKAVFDNNGNVVEYKPLNEFNHFSQLLSRSCTIMPDSVVLNDSYANNINAQILYLGVAFDNGVWYDILGHNYKYKYCIIWDYDRKIVKTDVNGNNLFEINTSPVEAKGSILINLNIGASLSRCVMVRFYRIDISANNKTVYVDVPLCGTRFMYDNGFSICGYRWRDYSDAVNGFGAVNLGINSIKFRGDNIECWSDNYPTKGNWKKGDVIYNTGTASEDKMWVIKGDINFG
ncbi:MAG: hypothetical protein RR015_04260, partial [Bacteroidales bacterium]